MLFSTLLFAAGLLVAETPDTLQTVTVVADRGVIVSRTDTFSTAGQLSAADALSQIPALYVGDYGALAGLKSVSLRGMGSSHTAIYVDGVRVGNVQSGQADLGSLGFDAFSSVVVDYAQNSVSFNTAKPVFGDSPVAGTVRMRGGSFGTYLPYARIDWKASDNLAVSANVAGIISKGNYHYGDGDVRTNSDMKQINAGFDLFGTVDRGSWHAKAGFNGAERGTPGSISWPSDDRQRDRNIFVQGVFNRRMTEIYTLDVSAKAAYDDLFYKSTWGDSQYGQTEVQLNTSHRFQVNEWLTVSGAADLQWDGLKSTNYNASRYSAVAALGSAVRLGNFKADLALEYNGIFDNGGLKRNVLSPSLQLRYSIIEGLDVVAFGRRAYRAPMFNELYYVGYGNPDLKPEDAWLTDLGIDYRKALNASWVISAKLDGFYNSLTNKITSAPSPDDPMVWLPYNIGKVESKGLDLAAGADYESGDWKTGVNVRYTLQNAVDKTDGSYTFDQQINYVPKHSVVLGANCGFRGWALDAKWNCRAGRRDSVGEMPDFDTLDLVFSKAITVRSCGPISLSVAVKNLLDKKYEILSGYPVPGLSVIGGVEVKF